MLRRCICLIVTVALVVCMSVASVGAVDATGSFTGHFGLGGQRSYFSIGIPRAGHKNNISMISSSSDQSVGFYLVDFVYEAAEGQSYPGGTVGVYFSWAAASSLSGTFREIDQVYNYTYSLGNTSTFTGTTTATSFNFSPPATPMVYPSNGQQFSIRIPDVDSLTSLSVNLAYNAPVFTPDAGNVPYDFYFYVPSASLIYTQSSAQLDSLENIADEIAAGNAIAQAMYGDIMEALNAISGDTELMASYINDCLTYLASIENKTLNIYNLCASYLYNLADIAQTADDIEAELESFHSDFMSKMDLLIGTITSESDDIQATMDRIYEQMIAWLETNFKEAISPEFEGSNSDLNHGIQNNDAIEQEWTGSLSDTWSAMHIADFTFDSSFTSGFMWVSGWFSNIYNSLGLYGSIVILPLIIGICKLLLGYFRFAGHGHSKGGGDVDA